MLMDWVSEQLLVSDGNLAPRLLAEDAPRSFAHLR